MNPKFTLPDVITHDTHNNSSTTHPQPVVKKHVLPVISHSNQNPVSEQVSSSTNSSNFMNNSTQNKEQSTSTSNPFVIQSGKSTSTPTEQKPGDLTKSTPQASTARHFIIPLNISTIQNSQNPNHDFSTTQIPSQLQSQYSNTENSSVSNQKPTSFSQNLSRISLQNSKPIQIFQYSPSYYPSPNFYTFQPSSQVNSAVVNISNINNINQNNSGSFVYSHQLPDGQNKNLLAFSVPGTNSIIAGVTTLSPSSSIPVLTQISPVSQISQLQSQNVQLPISVAQVPVASIAGENGSRFYALSPVTLSSITTGNTTNFTLNPITSINNISTINSIGNINNINSINNMNNLNNINNINNLNSMNNINNLNSMNNINNMTSMNSINSNTVNNLNNLNNININSINNMNINDNQQNLNTSVSSTKDNSQNSSSRALKPPTPVYFQDPDSGEYGIRCVCGQGHNEGILVQCESCDFWLHALCVNIARSSKTEHYFCPFCLNQVIRCRCGENKYNVPIIQCSKCHHWLHKNCEGLYFGINPQPFICSYCGGKDLCFNLPPFTLSDENYICEPIDHVPSYVIHPDNQSMLSLLSTLPDGPLKSMIIEDLDKPELSFQSVVERYFSFFANELFDTTHRDFWKIFTDALCSLLQCNRNDLLHALDCCVTRLLYAKPTVSQYSLLLENSNQNPADDSSLNAFEHSESISELLESATFTRYEHDMESIQLKLSETGHVVTPVPLEEGAFITELPGFLLHSDEVCCENGIPRSCVAITDSDLLIDLSESSFKFSPLMQRSFHFNCVVKLVRIKEKPRVALFATRMKGPLFEEKARRGPVISENQELILPFDGEIPFKIPKVEWKVKKTVKKPEIKEPIKPKRPRKQKPEKKKEIVETIPLTLLGTFSDPSVPPMPFILLPDKEAVEKYKSHQEIRSRSKNHHRSVHESDFSE